MSTTKKIEIYVCQLCGEYCDNVECFTCDDDNSAVITSVDYDLNKNLNELQDQLGSETSFKILLSHFGDSPGGFATITVAKQELLDILVEHEFLFNHVTMYGNQNCLGLALLKPYIYDAQPVHGIFINKE